MVRIWKHVQKYQLGISKEGSPFRELTALCGKSTKGRGMICSLNSPLFAIRLFFCFATQRGEMLLMK